MTERHHRGDYRDVIFDVTDYTATITINRPERLNAYTPRTLNEIRDAIEFSAKSAEVAAVVLEGAGGRAFSSGGDINFESGNTLARSSGDDDLDTFPGSVAALYGAFRACLKPIIAKVDGYAIGGGNHLAYFCDLTIASDRSVFGQNGARVGGPAEGWMVAQLVSIVGLRRAKEIWLLCKRYDARTALEWGLVNEVVPVDKLDEAVAACVENILSLSPTVLKVLKKTFDASFESVRAELEARDFLNEVNPEFFTSGEQEEGANAFLEKRAPNFYPYI